MKRIKNLINIIAGFNLIVTPMFLFYYLCKYESKFIIIISSILLVIHILVVFNLIGNENE